MDDLGDFLKKGFQRLHQKALEKDYKQKTINERREDRANLRRKTRETLMLQKRNIDLNNLTPICTPEVARQDNKINPLEIRSTNNTVGVTNNGLVAPPINKRLEMLKKWKMEKEKKIVEEKKKAKPLFKIYHVPVEVGLPNLENVNKEIKGIPIKKSESFKSQFAPDNHKFKPPQNIVPIKMNQPKGRLQKFELRKNFNMKTRTQHNSIKTIQISTQQTVNNKMHQSKTQENNKTNRLKSNLKIDEVKNTKKSPQLKTSELVKEGAIKSSLASKTPEAKKKPKKGVMWDVVKVIDSDDEILTQEIKALTPKKKYNKTPIKKRVAMIPDNYNDTLDNGDMISDTKELNTSTQSLKKTKDIVARHETGKNTKNKISNNSFSAEIIGQSPSSSKSRSSKYPVNETKINSITKTRSTRIKTGRPDRTPSKITEQSSKKMRRSISVEEVLPPKKTPSKSKGSRKRSDIFHTPQPRNHKLDSSSDTEDNMILYSKKMTASPSFDNATIEDKISISDKANEDNFTVSKKVTTETTKISKETSVLYSDEEITLKTPLKKLATPNILRKSILKSAETSTFKRLTSTPINAPKTDDDDPTVYISPFVTISRGKNSARKEYKIRLSTGGMIPNTPEFSRVSTKNTSPGAGAAYFAKKLKEETVRIEALCSEWTAFKEEIPDEVQDMVDAAIGQSKLLLSKKFQQFRSLIKLCEDGTTQDRPVTCTDLHGYWDTMYMQIEDIDKRFNNLKTLKDNDWKEVLVPEIKTVVQKRVRGRPKKFQAQSRIKDMLKNARLRKNNPDLFIENGECPISEKLLVEKPSSTKKRKSLLETFGNKENRKLSSSPGLAMLRLSQAIKCGDGLTPSKSILKTDSNRSEKRTTKSVLFKDLEDDKENSFENLMVFSPMTPRRSRRLSQLT